MERLIPGNPVLITSDPRCPRLAGLQAIYQGESEEGIATIQVGGDVGAVKMTVPKECLRLAEQHFCHDCGRPFWREVDSETERCDRCQSQATVMDTLDVDEVVTVGDIADWLSPERESGLDWDV